jgi:hypothetical protein
VNRQGAPAVAPTGRPLLQLMRNNWLPTEAIALCIRLIVTEAGI